MDQRNRNLFSFFAVLFTAGLITGVGGFFLLLADELGGNGPQLTLSNPVMSNKAEANSVSAAPTLSVSQTLGAHTATVLSVETDSEQSLIASGGYDNTVQLWDRSGQRAATLAHSGRVNDLVFTPDGQRLITGSGAGKITTWALPSGRLETSVRGRAGRILSLAIDSDGENLASGSSKGVLQIWSVSDAVQPLWILADVGPQINALAFHPTDNNLVLSGDQDGVIRIWDIASNRTIRMLDDGADRIVSLAVSADGKYVASGSYDQTIRVWSLETGDLLQTLSGHDFVVSDVAFSPDGRLLVSSSYDESIKTWDWAEGQSLCTLKGHAGFVYSVTVADSGNTIVSGGYDGTVRTWDLTAVPNESCLPR
ncbi:MAG: WD40 repeat domain-containing protein [Phormidesmis sp.]